MRSNKEKIFWAIVLIGVVILSYSAYAILRSVDQPIGNGEESGGGSGGGYAGPRCFTGACTPGSSYCYTDTTGGHACTCQNGGTWGPAVACSSFNQKCNTEGPGGRCV